MAEFLQKKDKRSSGESACIVHCLQQKRKFEGERGCVCARERVSVCAREKERESFDFLHLQQSLRDAQKCYIHVYI